jgi:dihydroxyacetone kinase-like predicted kinase
MTLQFLERNPGTTLESMNEKINDNNAFKNISNKPKIIVTVPSKKTAELFDEKFDITNFIRTDIVGNPSVDIFFKEFKKTNSSKIILILDDSNYLLSAQKAKELLPKNVCVEIYNTRSVANSYYLALLFNHEASYKENIKTLWKEIKSANVLKISKSIKDGIFNSIKVKRGQYIGIMDKKIINANFDLLSLTADTIKKMTGRSKKFDDILVFGGDETTKAQFKELKEFLEKEYKVDNLEIYDTDIQNYPFIIAFIE